MSAALEKFNIVADIICRRYDLYVGGYNILDEG